MLTERGEDGDDGVITKVSPWPMAETVARLLAVLAARGMEVSAVIDHTDEARSIGLSLRETRSFIVGSPSLSTEAIAAAPLTAVDLPLRVVVWDDGCHAKVSYPSPVEVARRHGLDPRLATGLESIDAAIDAVVAR